MPAPRSDRFAYGRILVLFCLMVLSAGWANAGNLRGLQDDLAAVNQAFAGASLDPAALEVCRADAAGDACLAALRANEAAATAMRTKPRADALGQRLSHVLVEEMVLRQQPELPAGAIPARLRLLGDGRVVHLEPLRALSPGATYEVLLEGLPVVALQVGPASSSEVAEAVATSLHESLPSFLPLSARNAARRLLGRLESQAAAAGGSPALAGARAVLAEPVTAEMLPAVRAAFVPVEPDGRESLLVIDDRIARLQAARQTLDDLPCEVVKLRSDRAAPGRYRFRGRFAARAPDGEIQWLPFMMALPEPLPEKPDLVFLVDGLNGSMARLFADQAQPLLARGLGVVSVELPRHGQRRSTQPYLEADNPAALAEIMQQGALDVMAAMRQIRRCGVDLAPGRRLVAGSFHYLGYSLGGMTGVLVRAAEPDLDRMVLVAPAADLADWLSLTAVRATGIPLVTCAGGEDHGRSCLGHGRCAGSGACLVNTSLESVGRHIRWSWQVAALGADPADYAARAAGPGRLLILSAGQDGILAPRQTYRLAEALGMQPDGPHRWIGEQALLREWPDLDHGLVGHPEVREAAHRFLADSP
jgi:hypothetical protein